MCNLNKFKHFCICQHFKICKNMVNIKEAMVKFKNNMYEHLSVSKNKGNIKEVMVEFNNNHSIFVCCRSYIHCCIQWY